MDTTTIEHAFEEKSRADWRVADALLAFVVDRLGTRDALRALAEYKKLGIPLPAARRAVKTAETFGPKDRYAELPYAMHEYVVTRTSEPFTWLAKASENRWTFMTLQSEVRSAKAAEVEEVVKGQFDDPLCIGTYHINSEERVEACVWIVRDDPPFMRHIRNGKIGVFRYGDELDAWIDSGMQAKRAIGQYLGILTEEMADAPVEIAA